MIKSYTEFLNEYDNNMGEDGFYLKHEVSISTYEYKLEEEIPGFIAVKFWDDLDALDAQEDCEKEMEDFQDSHLDLFYNRNHYESVTPLYNKIYRDVRDEMKKKGSVPRISIDSRVEQAIFKYIVDKYWDEWKKIYTEWLDYIHKKRGLISGKKFGVN